MDLEAAHPDSPRIPSAELQTLQPALGIMSYVAHVSHNRLELTPGPQVHELYTATSPLTGAFSTS